MPTLPLCGPYALAAWAVAALPPLAIGGHLTWRSWQVRIFTCCSCLSCFFPPDYAGPRYGIGYDWYHFWLAYGLLCGCCYGCLLDSIVPFHI